MSKENLDTVKLLLAEALVEEITSQPDFKSEGSDKVSDIFMRKLTLLHGLGLSRFWTSESLKYYASNELDGIALCSQQILRMALSFHARFVTKLTIALEIHAGPYLENLIKSIIDVSCIDVPTMATLQQSILARETVYFYSIDPRLAVTEESKEPSFISANLWLGSIYLALATGVIAEIIHEAQKGK